MGYRGDNREQVFTRIPAAAMRDLRRLAREQRRSVADLSRLWLLERLELELAGDNRKAGA